MVKGQGMGYQDCMGEVFFKRSAQCPQRFFPNGRHLAKARDKNVTAI